MVNIVGKPNPSPKPNRTRSNINPGMDGATKGVKRVEKLHKRTAKMRTLFPPNRLPSPDPITWLLMYPTAKEDNSHPWTESEKWNSFVIGMIAMGRITRSAALMRLAAEQSAIVRDDVLMFQTLMMLDVDQQRSK